jgi:hypothetical protein
VIVIGSEWLCVTSCDFTIAIIHIQKRWEIGESVACDELIASDFEIAQLGRIEQYSVDCG